jgi:membrane protease YdiL (CAAX protease family)
VASRSLAGPYPAFLIALVVVAPFVEELIHRGVAYPGLASRLGAVPAALVSSAVFAVAHGPGPFDIGSAFVSGLVWVWLYRRFDSLGPSTASHLVGNLLVFVSGWAAHNVFGIPGQVLS